MDSSNSNSVATKKDLEELRQELLGKLATKEEIEKLATKEDIKKLSFKIVMLATYYDEIKADQQNTKDVLLQAIDGLAKRLDDSLTEQAAFRHTFNRHEARLEDHEKRIITLEQQKS